MGLDNLLATLEKRESVTPVIPSCPQEVTAKASLIKACTLVTSVTPEKTTTAIAKPETLLDRQREARRQKVIAMLEAAPGKRYAVLVADASTDPVVVAVGIREIATFEMEIPHKYYDGMALLELIEKHSGEKYANN
jgi:hypothetical protein